MSLLYPRYCHFYSIVYYFIHTLIIKKCKAFNFYFGSFLIFYSFIMENPWLNGDAPADIWSDEGIPFDNYEERGFGNSDSVPWSEFQKLQQTLGERTEELFKVCRAFTEVCNLARSWVPDFYQKCCAQFIEGDQDIRPDDFLEKTYGKPPK